jgi:hypothetical protein
MVLLIVNKILMIVIAGYGTHCGFLQCSREPQNLECKKSLNLDL